MSELARYVSVSGRMMREGRMEGGGVLLVEVAGQMQTTKNRTFAGPTRTNTHT